jgi:hypothetical protein
LNYFENDTTTTTSATSVSIFGRGKPKQPFSDENDKRLYELDYEIPDIRHKWNKQKKNAMECFTKETLEAKTSRSAANGIKFLLHGGLQFVLTRRFSTDNFECFYVSVRNYCGSNGHPAIRPLHECD